MKFQNDMASNSLLHDEYATKDLYFAAFLYVKSIPLKKLEKYGSNDNNLADTNSRSNTPVYFIFSNRQRCEKLEDVFWNGIGDEVMVNVKEYFTAIRDLKSRAFSISTMVNQIESNLENS